MVQLGMQMGVQMQMAYSDQAAHVKSVLDNFDLEASERRRMIEDELAAGLATLKRQLEREMARLAKGAAAHLTAAQFLEIHGASIDNVAKHNNEGKVRREMDDIEQDIERTVKKRKRVPNASPEKINNSDLDAGSPSKLRKNMRTAAPPTPSRTNTASSSIGIGRSASRPRLVSAGSRASSSTFISSNSASTSNFIYRARPSAVNPYTINPRLPQTPQFRSGSIFTSSSKTVTANDGNKTAKRMPRRNESIQAYSMNGSPLGVLDIAVDNKQNSETTGSSAPPSSDISNAEGSIEADWEVLQPRSATNASVPFPSLQNTASKSTISPSKLLRKPSAATLNGGGGGGGASSTFKAAIVAGANRVKAKTSSSSLNSRIFGYHSNNNNNNSASADFTFQAPSMLSPGKSKTDWENWARSFKAELEGMNMNPEDKRRLERRMMELVQK